MSSNFTFVDELPERQSQPVRQPDKLITEFAQACKDNHGMWSVYPKPLSSTSVRTYAAAINHARANVPGCLANGEFEAAARDGKLWIRHKSASDNPDRLDS